ncbi:hypothetical protein MPSEU_000446100 [Mayamaea pseudoterrestris]|nr:hypothetical protein MPSEU_000446100 [Mayamaea pseudoterrestris]
MLVFSFTPTSLTALLFVLLATAIWTSSAHESTLKLKARSGFRIRLPKAISDHTANLVEDAATGTKSIYIMGGCDAQNGNVFNKGFGEFICSSISNKLYKLDTATQNITIMADMPTERYRHAAAVINNKHIWVAGGRDLDDYIIPTIDVYDISKNSWRSFDVDEAYQSSDLGGFGKGNNAFFVGGYNYTYGFRDAVFAIDSRASLASGSSSLVIQDKAPLRVARGDLTAVVNDDETYAIVTGGFGVTNEFCAPLAEVERYNFNDDSWRLIAPMNKPRSDIALVELNGNIIALGGERQILNICEIDPPEVGEATFAVDDVEVLDVNASSCSTKWTVLQDLPQNRFRLAAVALDDENAVYTFGGQEDYNSTCQCYRPTRQVIIYDATEVEHDHATEQDSFNAESSTGSLGDTCSSASYTMRGYLWAAFVGTTAVMLA